MAVSGPSLIPGRFISTASFVGILAMVVLLIRKLGAGITVSILAAGIMLAFPWPVNWSQVVRVDTLGIFLSITGIYFWTRSSRISDAVLTSPFFALAVFTKHSLLAAPLAAIVAAVISRDRRTSTLVLGFAIFVALEYGLGEALTGGGLLVHLLRYTANAFFFERFTAGVGQYFQMTWLLQVLAVSTLAIPEALAGPKKIVGWYYLLSHLTLIAYGFEGSDTNYYIEPLLATALMAGLALNELTRIESRPLPFSIPSGRTIGFARTFSVLILGRFLDMSQYRIERISSERLDNGMNLVELATHAPGDILSEDASFTILANKPVLFQPYIMTLLSRTGKWDQTPFVQSIDDERYSMIVMRVDLSQANSTEERGGAWEEAGFDRWTKEMEQAIRDHYQLWGGLDVGVGNLWYVYLANSQSPQ